MRRALRGLAAALALGLAAGAGPAAAAPEAAPDTIGVRLLDGPADRQDDPRALTYVVDHVAPGERVERRVAVTNTTGAPVEVELYPGGARVDGGGFTFSPRGQGDTELTAWTTVDPPVVTVPAQGEAEAVVRIAVPPDAAPGEQYGVVWAEPPASSGGDVAVVHRVGVRVYLSVGAGGEPPTAFSISSVQPRSGSGGPQLVARVRNDGGRAVDLTGDLSLRGGPGGVSAGPVASRGATTLGVGRSGEVVFALDPALPPGPWTADVVLRSGRVEQTTTAAVTLDPPATGPSGDPRAGAVLWTGGLVATALLVAVGIGVTARRRALRAVNG